MSHVLGKSCGGFVFVGVVHLVSLNQMPSMLNIDHFILFSMYYRQLTSKMHQLLLVVKVLLDYAPYTTYYTFSNFFNGIKR